MSGNDRSAAYAIYNETLALPAGVTAAILPMGGQIGVIFKYVSGGSLSIAGFSAASGSTYAISQLYTVGTGEVVNIALSGAIYLIATGSTCVCAMTRMGSGATFI